MNEKIYDKYVVDNSPTMGEGFTVGGNGVMGEAKYSGSTGKNLYDDPTRDTENDKEAEKGYDEMKDRCDPESEAMGAGRRGNN